MNMYAYVGNDPVNMVDPTGEIACGGACIGTVVVASAKACVKNNSCRKTVVKYTAILLSAAAIIDLSIDANETIKEAGAARDRKYETLNNILNGTGTIDEAAVANAEYEAAYANQVRAIGNVGSAVTPTGNSVVSDLISINNLVKTLTSDDTSNGGSATNATDPNATSNSDPYKKGLGGKTCVATGAGMNRCPS
jgi:hypothetical protein